MNEIASDLGPIAGLANVGEIDRRTYRKSVPGKLERRADEVRSMYRRGMTQQEIADALDVTQRAVMMFMRRHSVQQRPQVKRDQRGEKNSTWAGSAITYKGAHQRVANARGKPSLCEDCGTTTAKVFDWANVSGAYHDPNDYKRLCRPCHRKFDKARRLQEYA